MPTPRRANLPRTYRCEQCARRLVGPDVGPTLATLQMYFDRNARANSHLLCQPATCLANVPPHSRLSAGSVLQQVGSHPAPGVSAGAVPGFTPPGGAAGSQGTRSATRQAGSRVPPALQTPPRARGGGKGKGKGEGKGERARSGTPTRSVPPPPLPVLAATQQAGDTTAGDWISKLDPDSGQTSHGPWSHSDAASYISSVILDTKYAKRCPNGSTAHG